MKCGICRSPSQPSQVSSAKSLTSSEKYVCQLHHMLASCTIYICQLHRIFCQFHHIYVCQLHHICLPVAPNILPVEPYMFTSCTIYMFASCTEYFSSVAPYICLPVASYMFSSCIIYVFRSFRSYKLLKMHSKRSFITEFLLKIFMCTLPQKFDKEKQGAAVDQYLANWGL